MTKTELSKHNALTIGTAATEQNDLLVALSAIFSAYVTSKGDKLSLGLNGTLVVEAMEEV